MTHSVPPPEPPAIIQNLAPQIAPNGERVDEPLTITQSLTNNSLSSSRLIESLKPAASINAVKSAAFLGSQMAVGYQVDEFEITNLTDIGLNQAAAPSRVEESRGSTLSRGRKAACRLSLASCLTTRHNKVLISQVAPTTDSNNSSPSPTLPVELDFRAPTVETQPPSQPQPQSQPSQPTPPSSPPAKRRVVEVNSDSQEYDIQRQIVTAEGNVVVRINDAVLDADRLQVNLPNLIAVGEGNVAFTRGQQVLRGQRFTYNILQNRGDLEGGRGDIFLPTAGADFSDTLPTDVTAGGVLTRPPSDRFTSNQPLQQVTSPGGINFTVGGSGRSNVPGAQQGGTVRRLRFEADQIDFYPQGWQARDVRITNDPYSPPELELRADTVTLTREAPGRDRIRTKRQRLVFDRGLTIPIPRDQAVIDRNQQRDVSPAIAQVGFDGEDRGGLFIERGFSVFNSEPVQLTIKPQFYVQKAVADNSGNPADLFGLKTNLRANLGLRTAITGFATFTSLDFGDIEDSLRANLRLQQLVGGSRFAHTAALEATYRDRIYNGTLGYRTVQSSIGATLTSPIIPLGKSGINLSYQAGFQQINAETDRPELLESDRENDRTSLNRLQGTFALNRGFLLWQGKGLPATATEGLKYTPAPVVPYIAAYAGVTGTGGFYSNGDSQTTLIGTVGIGGQFGHFSRPFLDFTGFNISYSEGIRSGVSPFLFDRAADTRVVSFGITQQIYGPLRLGIQTAINLDNNESLSTDYILEYSRRTYGVFLRYNPQQEIGSISFRLSDFNWSGSSDPFSDSEVRPVVNGVRR
jgi:hypothetical protein